MCDYSLMEYQNRLAVKGEVLMVHRFPTGSHGLASQEDCCRAAAPAVKGHTFWSALKEFFQPTVTQSVPAVCIPPGASLTLHDVPLHIQKSFGVGPDEDITFVQLSGTPYSYRDAVRFRTGDTLRLQELQEGQRLDVLDLGSGDMEEPAALPEAYPLTGVSRF